jgi:glycosyltransferase involved in cell wall biosynthesis
VTASTVEGDDDRPQGPSLSRSPLVSIVTPSFNSEAFLEQTILSVVGQTYPNIEYIVIDGGSTDRTVETIERHGTAIARWLSEPDNGQGDALRKGFALATGEVLAWINSDDVYPPDAVESAVAALEQSGADLVYGNRGVIDAEDRTIGERRLSPFLPFFSQRGVLYGGFGIYQPAAFWTRALYERVGGIDASYSHCMDTDLVTRFAVAGAKFKFVKKDLVAFRLHGDSKTSMLAPQMRQERDRIVAGLPHRNALYRSMIRLVCRAWRVLYDIRDSHGRYMLGRVLDRRYRYLQ